MTEENARRFVSLATWNEAPADIKFLVDLVRCTIKSQFDAWQLMSYVASNPLHTAFYDLVEYERHVSALYPGGEQSASKFMQQGLTVRRRKLKSLISSAPDYGLPAVDGH